MEQDKDKIDRIISVTLGATRLDAYEENTYSFGDWINWGKDNLWPQYLNTLKSKSPEHASVLRGKSQMMAGGGWDQTGLSNEAQLFIRNIKNELDLDEIVARNASGLETYNGFFLNIRWSADRSKIAEINYIDPSTVRIKKPKPGEPQSYYVCDDWSNPRKYKPVLFRGYSYVDRSEQSQILYVKDYTEGCEFYSLPTYYAGINYIEMEYKISQFQLSNIDNGFSPNLMITFLTGVPNKEMMDGIIKRLRDEYSGPVGQKVFFLFADGKDDAPIITPLSVDDQSEKFKEVNGLIENSIFRAHCVNNPSLFGVKTPGELGGTNEILDSLSVFQAMYINPRQRILEKTFNRLARVNGIQDDLKLNKYQLKMEVKSNPSDIISILTSTISDEQKIQVFISLGYTEDQALLLTKNNKITDGNQIN